MLLVAFVAVLTLTLICIVLAKPTRAVYLVLLAIPMSNLKFDVGFTVQPVHVLLVLAGVCCALREIALKGRQEAIRDWTWLVVLTVYFVINALITAPEHVGDYSNIYGGAFRQPAQHVWIQIARLVLAVSAYFVVDRLITRRLELHRAINVLIWSTVAASAYGLYQVIGELYGLPFVLRHFDAVSGQFRDAAVMYESIPRAFGVSDEPRELGILIVPVLSLCISLVVAGPARPLGWTRLRLTGVMAVLATTLMLTFSRSAWLAVGLSLPFVLLVVPYLTRNPSAFPRIRWAYVGIVLAITAGMISLLVRAPISGGNLFSSRLAEISIVFDEEYIEARKSLLAVDLVRERPLLGVGLGYFPYYWLERNPFDLERIEAVTIGYLSVAAEGGLTGVFLLGLFVFRKLRAAVVAAKATASPEHHDLLVGVIALALAYLVCFANRQFPDYSLFMFFGLLSAAARLAHSAPATSSEFASAVMSGSRRVITTPRPPAGRPYGSPGFGPEQRQSSLGEVTS